MCRYEGRCGFPTNFDAAYCYALGFAAGALLHCGKTGLISSVGSSFRLIIFVLFDQSSFFFIFPISHSAYSVQTLVILSKVIVFNN